MGQNTSNSVWKPCEDLQKTFDLCHCQQRVYNKVLRLHFVIDQILIFHHNLQINSLKILQCDFLDFFSYFVSHSWGIPMMKITGLSHLFKWENLHNWWLTKYFFAPLYILLISWTCACHDSSDISYTSDAYCLQDSFKRNQKICINFENMEDCLFIYDVLHQMQAAVPLLECFLIFNRSTQVPQKLLTSRSLCASLKWKHGFHDGGLEAV